jgi:cytochrome c oxidase subunit 2
MKTQNFIITLAIILVLVGGFIFLGKSNTSSNEGSAQKINPNVELTGETKEFEIIASNWDWTPAQIEVNKGDRVKLKLKSIEGTHGFSLYDFGINERLVPGKEVEVEFIADKTGRFVYFCNIPCGQGHGGMSGFLIVK